MENNTVTLIGATGLIGSHILRLLEADPYFSRIRVLVRRPFDTTSPKTDVMVVNFEDETQVRQALAGSSAVFCAIGTTNSKVKGDKAAYRMVDHDIPVRTARLCKETACPQLLLVSSVGADAGSRNFYLKLKGQVEDEIRQTGLHAVAVFRPSLLLGKRKEFRAGERLAQWIMPVFGTFLPSRLRPVQARDVALAMVTACKKAIPGYHVLHYNEIRAYAGM